MGWLFGGKKVPKVPLPRGMLTDDGTLRFPSAPQQRAIQSEEVKAAVGFEKQFSFPDDVPEMPETDYTAGSGQETSLESNSSEEIQGPLFVKVEAYQSILAYLDGLRWDLNKLGETNRQLDSSEYNEEAHFERLRRSVKSVHDKLLQVDKVLFKSQGD